jgi:hypothetical protein
MGRQALIKLEQAYRQFADHEERLPASYEVVYGHAWSGGRQPASGDGNNTQTQQVSVDLLRPGR